MASTLPSSSSPPVRNILILGARGMLGRDVTEAVRNLSGSVIASDAAVWAWDIDELDITDDERVQAAFEKLGPQLVINCAAYTDVDGCESNQQIAYAVNAEAPKWLAQACQSRQAKLVYISTDYVFNGRSETAYLPDHPADPINEYGRSKWQGEQHIRGILDNHLIIRTSWLFGPRGKNFVKTIRDLARQRDRLDVVTDQFGCPTLTIDLANAIFRLVSAEAVGTFHFSNTGKCSWFDFACEIVRQYELNCEIRPTTSDHFVRPAARPGFSVMDLSAYIQATGHTPRAWRQALTDYVRLDPS